MTTATNRTAEYKGHSYRLLYLGQTKYGKRAHLQFMDGSKDFWVDASLVREKSAGESSTNRASGRGRATCAECGRPGELVSDLEDGMMKHRRCCDIEPD